MKKVSRIIALSLAIMLISGVAVFASEITSVTGSGTAAAPIIADGDITVTAVAPTTVDQVTVVVYKGATADENSIAYIDQKPNTTGTVVFTFKMRDAFTDGEYTVKVGGTDVTTANDTAKVNWKATDVVKYKITGSVTGVGVSPITVDAKTAGVATGTVTVTGNTYEVAGLDDAQVVTLTIGMKGNITYQKDVTIPAADVVKDVTLFGGDAYVDNKIDVSDLAAILVCWGKRVGDTGFSDDANVFNNDNVIDVSDFAAVLVNWGKTQASYTN